MKVFEPLPSGPLFPWICPRLEPVTVTAGVGRGFFSEMGITNSTDIVSSQRKQLQPEVLASNSSLMQTALLSIALGRVTGPSRERNNPRQGLTAKSRSLEMRSKAHIFNSCPLK